MTKWIIIFLVLMCSYAQAIPFSVSSSSVTSTAETVTASLASTSNTIPVDFVGISWELSSFIAGDLQGASGASLSGIITLLGPNGNLRVGGNAQDPFTTAPALTQPLANSLAAFLSSIGSGWWLTYGLDYNVPATQVTQVGYIINAMGSTKTVFAIGNEQNLDSTNEANWNSAYATLIAAYPTMIFEGPECAAGCFGSFITNWVSALTPGVAGLAYVSYHKYNGSGFYSPASSWIPGGFGQDSVVNAFAPGKVRLGEWNTESSGGFQGVSDRLVAAAFYIETCMNLASSGYAGVNSHEVNNEPNFVGMHRNPTGAGTNAAYNGFIQQVDGGWTPAAKFYGMLLFSKLQGQVIAATSKSGTGNVSAFATVGANGNANILIVNNDSAAPVVITATQSSGAWTTAKVWNVGSATKNWCFDNIATLNGQTIGEGGTNVAGAKVINNGDTISVIPCGAALIQIQP